MSQTWELIGFNTDQRYEDVRWREYTTSESRAAAFGRIPKIQFTDSGHGIVFDAQRHKGPRKPEVREVTRWVSHWLRIIAANDRLRKMLAKVTAAAVAEEATFHAALKTLDYVNKDADAAMMASNAADLYGDLAQRLSNVNESLKP